MRDMNTNLLSNPNNPHYFICEGKINIINGHTTIMGMLPFKDASFATKYAKSLGQTYFAVFATHMEWEKMLHLSHPYPFKVGAVK